ncbi:hypothetical protein AHAS_Ahas05G0088800 [Arachis hypogaea]
MVHKLDSLETWNLMVEDVLQAMGFYHVSKIGVIEGFYSLLSAFVERWRPETYTYVLPVEDPHLQLGAACLTHLYKTLCHASRFVWTSTKIASKFLNIHLIHQHSHHDQSSDHAEPSRYSHNSQLNGHSQHSRQSPSNRFIPHDLSTIPSPPESGR